MQASAGIHPVVPPKVEYRLTDLGLGAAFFCGVWIRAADNLQQVEKAGGDFDARAAKIAAGTAK